MRREKVIMRGMNTLRDNRSKKEGSQSYWTAVTNKKYIREWNHAKKKNKRIPNEKRPFVCKEETRMDAKKRTKQLSKDMSL